MRILITAGPTREDIDPVRFITNHSSGKMGYALAEAAVEKGHQVTLVSGPVVLTPPTGLEAFLPVVSAAQMAEAVKSVFPEMNMAILCAAVADYRPVTVSTEKIKKSDGELVLRLERTEDILKSLGEMKREGQQLVGFAAETSCVEDNAAEKIRKKNLDWIAANHVGLPDRGFQAENNAVILLSRCGHRMEFPLMNKRILAGKILDAIFENGLPIKK